MPEFLVGRAKDKKHSTRPKNNHSRIISFLKKNFVFVIIVIITTIFGLISPTDLILIPMILRLILIFLIITLLYSIAFIPIYKIIKVFLTEQMFDKIKIKGFYLYSLSYVFSYLYTGLLLAGGIEKTLSFENNLNALLLGCVFLTAIKFINILKPSISEIFNDIIYGLIFFLFLYLFYLALEKGDIYGEFFSVFSFDKIFIAIYLSIATFLGEFILTKIKKNKFLIRLSKKIHIN